MLIKGSGGFRILGIVYTQDAKSFPIISTPFSAPRKCAYYEWAQYTIVSLTSENQVNDKYQSSTLVHGTQGRLKGNHMTVRHDLPLIRNRLSLAIF